MNASSGSISSSGSFLSGGRCAPGSSSSSSSSTLQPPLRFRRRGAAAARAAAAAAAAKSAAGRPRRLSVLLLFLPPRRLLSSSVFRFASALSASITVSFAAMNASRGSNASSSSSAAPGAGAGASSSPRPRPRRSSLRRIRRLRRGRREGRLVSLLHRLFHLAASRAPFLDASPSFFGGGVERAGAGRIVSVRRGSPVVGSAGNGLGVCVASRSLRVDVGVRVVVVAGALGGGFAGCGRLTRLETLADALAKRAFARFLLLGAPALVVVRGVAGGVRCRLLLLRALPWLRHDRRGRAAAAEWVREGRRDQISRGRVRSGGWPKQVQARWAPTESGGRMRDAAESVRRRVRGRLTRLEPRVRIDPSG